MPPKKESTGPVATPIESLEQWATICGDAATKDFLFVVETHVAWCVAARPWDAPAERENRNTTLARGQVRAYGCHHLDVPKAEQGVRGEEVALPRGARPQPHYHHDSASLSRLGAA